VGSYKPNAFGVFDTLGNVSEWTEDCWHDGYHGAPGNGGAWTTGGECDKRVLRGGSWNYLPRNLRSANRYRYSSVIRYLVIGFRVARTL
jgi:formylglycine-generating enzyme required for sulfatase activity